MAPGLLAAGAALHGLEISYRSLVAGHIAVASFDEGLSFLAFSLAILYLLIDRRYVLAALGAVIAPLATLLTLVALIVSSGTTTLPPALRSAWLPVHVTLAFLGNAVFAIAFATSAVYLFEDSRLKSKRPPLRRRPLPSLERLDDLNHRLLSWGFPLLTLGIVTGAIWAHFALVLLVVGSTRDLVADHLDALRAASPRANRRLERAASGDVDDRRLRGPAALVRRRERAVSGPRRRELRLVSARRKLWLVGLSHDSAPVELRERLALENGAAALVGQRLRQMSGLDECAVVSTCNRVEVVACGTPASCRRRQASGRPRPR